LRKADFITGAFLFALSLLFYFYLIPVHIVTFVDESNPTLRADFLPRIFAFGLALLSILLILNTWKSEESDVEVKETSLRAVYQVAVVGVAACVYIFMQEVVGFLVSAPLFLGGLIYFFGTREWRRLLPVAILFPVVLNYFFWYSFQILLPQGTLW
jgi:hypothetical protein